MKGPIDFENAMHGIYVRAKRDVGYDAKIFLDMLHRHGGLGTAKKLINSSSVSAGYTALHSRGRIDLTVEAVILENPQWHELFSEKELEICRKRLEAYQYVPKVKP